MKVRKQYSLKKLNTFGIDVSAKEFIEFETETEISKWIQQVRPDESDVLILGGGSNYLFTKDIDKTVLFPAMKHIQVIRETETDVYVEAGAGIVWDDFVAYCVERNWGGIENLSLIPGNVGATPVQNIGAYGVEIEDVLHETTTIELSTGNERVFNRADCDLSYRNSYFKQEGKGKYIVTKVSFKLTKQPKANLSYRSLTQHFAEVSSPTIQEVRDAVIAIRNAKLPDPEVIGNAGSFFKNPIVDGPTAERLLECFPKLVSFPLENGETKLAAGWLIQTTGMKGFRSGDAGVYEKQALVLVNHGNAKGHEIFELSRNIQQKVVEMFGVDLEPEVNIIH